MTIPSPLKKYVPNSVLNLFKKLLSSQPSTEPQILKPEVNIDDLVKSGFSHLFNNQFREALEKIEIALQAQPNHILARSAMARLCRNWKKDEEALNHALFVNEINPEDFYNREVLGLILRDLSRFEESLEVFKTMENFPSDHQKTLSLQLTAKVLQAVVDKQASSGIQTIIDHIKYFELNSWEPYKQIYWALKMMGDSKGAQLAAVGRFIEGAPKDSLKFLKNKTISLEEVQKKGGLVDQFKLTVATLAPISHYCEVNCPAGSQNPFNPSYGFDQKEPIFLTFKNTTCLSWNFGTAFFFKDFLIEGIQENDGLLAQLRDELPAAEPVHGTVLSLAYPWGGGFFHFIMESLSTIAAASNSGKIKEVDYFYLSQRSEYQVKILSHLGIDESRLIFGDRSPHIKPEKLMVVKDSTPEFPDYEAQFWVCKFIRETFLPLGKMSNLPVSKRVYIGRGPNTNGRSITNEKVLLDYLKKYDFAHVHPENLSFNDQVKLFSEADVIIAPAGSALLNLLFCRKNTKVLILYPPYCIWRIYWSISSFFELKKSAIFGRKKDTLPVLDPDWMEIEDNASFEVDFSQFKETVEKMQIAEPS